MKSKITIDLDFDNQPIIKIDYIPSEDVRDKMIKRFLESFSSSSTWVRLRYESSKDDSISILRPIPPDEMEKNSHEMFNLSKVLKGEIITTTS